MRPLADVASRLGLAASDLEMRGAFAAKLAPALMAEAKRPPRGKLVVVTSATPTKHGEGKTLTAIGLAQALARVGTRALVALREPSLGPVFGAKGGATGGGASQVLPPDDINLHFTGDKHAVTAAQNLVAAMIDAHVEHGNARRVDPERIVHPRCLDMNDKRLRAQGFVITAATETMACLALSLDLAELRERLARMMVAWDRDGRPVRAGELGAAGAATALLRDAIRPNLVQTTEGTPAFVHAGPFANVSLGTSSAVADRIGLRLADVVVTEAGFGAELGLEKLVDVFAPQAGLAPDLAVVVASVRALAEHGLSNLDWHVGLARRLGLPVVVAVNRFAGDTDEQVRAVVRHCEARGVAAAAHDCFARGGAGGEELARAVLDALRTPSRPTPLYDAASPFEEKVAALATHAYGADGVVLEAAAQASLASLRAAGYGALPVCVAKTPLSLSTDPHAIGVPKGWVLHVRDLQVHAGGGYLVALAGGVTLMPALGAEPAALHIDVAPDGRIVGL